jgi:nucleoside-diphosphate-sugar epimerase
MENLIIGNTSQLSRYFPEDYFGISSRKIDYNFIASKKWENIFLCFAEQRTFFKDSSAAFFDVNYSYTIDVVENIRNHCDKIYFYSTSYLWNAYEGEVDLSMPYKYYSTSYIESKELISRYLLNNVKNAIILYPCNFNSVYRKGGFLFHKIFDSIIHRKKVVVGDTHFLREMVHPRYVVRESLKATNHAMIGAGYVIDVNEFMRDLYRSFGLEYEYYVKEELIRSGSNRTSKYYCTRKNIIDYTRDDLMKDTINELEKLIKW